MLLFVENQGEGFTSRVGLHSATTGGVRGWLWWGPIRIKTGVFPTSLDIIFHVSTDSRCSGYGVVVMA